jgi:hypothetical protein
VLVRFSLFLVTVEVVTFREEGVGGTETREIDKLGPHTSSLPSPLRSVSTGQDINDEAQPVVSQAEGVTSIWPCCRIPSRLFCSITASRGGGDTPEKPEMNITGDGLTQAEAQIRTCFPTIVEISNVLTNVYIAADTIPTLDPGPRNTTSDSESKEPRMIGDFDGSANEFWKLYRDEAKSHDDATISTLKDGMDSALIFVRSYSVHAPIIDLVFLIRGHRLVYSLPFSQHS